MTIANAAAFFDKAIMDEAIQSQIAAATAGKEPQEKAAAVAALGNSLGYEFTANEAATVRKLVRNASGADDGELDEVDLAVVTGGSETARQVGVAFVEQGGHMAGYVLPMGLAEGVAGGIVALINGGGAKEFGEGFAQGANNAI